MRWDHFASRVSCTRANIHQAASNGVHSKGTLVALVVNYFYRLVLMIMMMIIHLDDHCLLGCAQLGASDERRRSSRDGAAARPSLLGSQRSFSPPKPQSQRTNGPDLIYLFALVITQQQQRSHSMPDGLTQLNTAPQARLTFDASQLAIWPRLALLRDRPLVCARSPSKRRRVIPCCATIGPRSQRCSSRDDRFDSDSHSHSRSLALVDWPGESECCLFFC